MMKVVTLALLFCASLAKFEAYRNVLLGETALT